MGQTLTGCCSKPFFRRDSHRKIHFVQFSPAGRTPRHLLEKYHEHIASLTDNVYFPRLITRDTDLSSLLMTRGIWSREASLVVAELQRSTAGRAVLREEEQSRKTGFISNHEKKQRPEVTDHVRYAGLMNRSPRPFFD